MRAPASPGSESDGFHAGSREKALKAYLYSRGEEMVLGHSIDGLASTCEGYNAAFSDRRPEWARLDAYYVATRYPNALPGSIPARIFNKEQAERAVALARDAVSFVAAHVNR